MRDPCKVPILRHASAATTLWCGFKYFFGAFRDSQSVVDGIQSPMYTTDLKQYLLNYVVHLKDRKGTKLLLIMVFIIIAVCSVSSNFEVTMIAGGVLAGTLAAFVTQS